MLTAILSMAMALLPAGPSLAQGGQEFVNREYPIKAAFLYNFGGYVEWPATAFANDGDPFIIGVLGPDPFGAALDKLAATKKIGGRRIVVERFTSVEQLKPCHILFIGRQVDRNVQQAAVVRLRSAHTLLVGESTGFASQGGVFNFFIDDNRVQFEINIQAANEHELRVSSKLLALARVIGRE